MSVGTKMVREKNWPIISFFVATTTAALIGAPLYIYRYGISISEILIFLFFIAATGISITIGYHRLYAHVTFKAHKIIQLFVLFFGAAAFEQSALTWSSGHRDHHRYVDTDLDPYNIKKGFWYAHIGWMTLWKQEPDYNNVKDLLKDKLTMQQHYNYVLWGLVSGFMLPIMLGALTGHALGAFIFAVCVRLTLVYHATFCINSICHTFGKPTYDIYSTAKDNWFTAIITNGEGYHNFHHRFPTDYRNGIRWYHWDPSKWMIALLARTGLVSGLQRVSEFSILQAKIAAENQSICDQLIRIKDANRMATMKETLQTQYSLLIQNLSAWESSVKAYQLSIKSTIANRSDELRETLLRQVQKAKSDFQKTRREWSNINKSWALDL